MLGTSNFETTTTIEPAIVNTKGQSRQIAESNQGYSIAYAFEKRREVVVPSKKKLIYWLDLNAILNTHFRDHTDDRGGEWENA